MMCILIFNIFNDTFHVTTGKVENWVLDDVADTLIFDEDMRKKLQTNNPYATLKMSELLMESNRRGYWKVKKEKLSELQNIILNITVKLFYIL